MTLLNKTRYSKLFGRGLVSTRADQPLRHVRPRGPRSQGARGIMPSGKNLIKGAFTTNIVLFHLNCLSVADLLPLSLGYPRTTGSLLTFSTILSRIHYFNIAFAGLPQRSIIRLQAVINAAARLILRVKKFDHISTLLRD